MRQGYYNWHVPITWIIAFVSIISSYIYDFKNIVLSNEKVSPVKKILFGSDWK